MKNVYKSLGLFVALVLVASSAFAGPTPPPSVPEPVSTSMLLGISVFGLVIGRKFARK